MAARINPLWVERVSDLIKTGAQIDELSSYNPATQWLIESLSRVNQPFKIYNLGAGVKRITTITDVCPCCKRPL
jgi:hypothetical protein